MKYKEQPNEWCGKSNKKNKFAMAMAMAIWLMGYGYGYMAMAMAMASKQVLSNLANPNFAD